MRKPYLPITCPLLAMLSNVMLIPIVVCTTLPNLCGELRITQFTEFSHNLQVKVFLFAERNEEEGKVPKFANCSNMAVHCYASSAIPLYRKGRVFVLYHKNLPNNEKKKR
ncbi:hypothetical protein CEXT_89911 [Caerostris extrusa]|uniref:Secreted protein n=1 Tax=Caerostris extrusa TaxID=172846 RepID=A0AAV4XIG7_CAEEX|nr:hypothetical protein CEXT_89911 [Caerostris extrusa]